MLFDSRDVKSLPSVGSVVTRPFGDRLAWLITRRTRDKTKNVYVDLRSEDGSRVHHTVKVESLELWPQPGDIVLVSSGQVEEWLRRRADLVVSELRAQLVNESPSGSDYGLRGILGNHTHRGESRYRKFRERWKKIDEFRSGIESLDHPLHKPLLYKRQASSGLAVVAPVDDKPPKRYQLPVYALHVLERSSEEAA